MKQKAVSRVADYRIPFFIPDIGEDAIQRVGDSIRSGWLTTGPQTAQFEDEFRRYVGADYAVAVSSCTAALHLALVAHGIGPGDEVITPTMTFVATVEVVVHTGARPVLVDVNPDNLNIDPALVERAVTQRTKAVIPVHYGGHPAPMDEILQIARRHRLLVIEDAAHALPARYRGRPVGSIGDSTCFSFYANKTITTGEGGMITTNDRAVADRVRSLSLHGMSSDAWDRYTAAGPWDYKVVAAGYKYNLSDIAASIGIEQLARADAFAAARTEIAGIYDELFADSDLVTPLGVDGAIDHARHLYVVRLNIAALKLDRSSIMEALRERGIGTSVHYRPVHMHQHYQDLLGHVPDDFPVAARAFDEVVSLPIYPKMTRSDAEYVASCLLSVAAMARQ